MPLLSAEIAQVLVYLGTARGSPGVGVWRTITGGRHEAVARHPSG